MADHEMADLVGDLALLLDQDAFSGERLMSWNDSIEASLLEHRQQNLQGIGLAKEIPAEDLTARLTVKLNGIFLSALNGSSLSNITHVDSNDEYAIGVLERWKDIESGTSIEKASQDQVEIMRAAQNWLRYYVQILASTSARSLQRDLIGCWKSQTMLELYLVLLERFQGSELHSDCAKFASQIFFYATFPARAHDEALRMAFGYVTSAKVGLMQRLLRALVQKASLPLTLSLIRNVHNAASSFPQHSIKPLQAAFVDCNDVTIEVLNSWVPIETGLSTVTYATALRELLLSTIQSDTFPGEDNRTTELVVEILRTCYSTSIPGKDLFLDESWRKCVSVLLTLDFQQEQCFECQLASFYLFMETRNRSAEEQCSSFLLEYLETVLEILSRQISFVTEKQYVDDRGVAALSPILVVLHKCCNASSDFLTALRERIFTNEDAFLELIAQQGHGEARNMLPLDAPNGTLCWKLFQMLTWPQGFVK